MVLTLGAQGALLIDGQTHLLIAPFSIEPVDTTAAGDAFVGGLAVALTQNQALPEAVRWGNATGALAATKLGAQPSLPDRHALETMLMSISSQKKENL